MKTEDIPEAFLYEEFVRSAAGPGGQHVNRTESTVRLHFRFRDCPGMTDAFRSRLARLACVSELDEELIVQERSSRSLQQNREKARERLGGLLAKAAVVPKKRRPTKPTKASKERRLASKSKRSRLKKERAGIYD